MMGGAMIYRNSMLKMRAMQFRITITRLMMMAIAASQTRI